jgi:hypothetical protein
VTTANRAVARKMDGAKGVSILNGFCFVAMLCTRMYTIPIRHEQKTSIGERHPRKSDSALKSFTSPPPNFPFEITYTA